MTKKLAAAYASAMLCGILTRMKAKHRAKLLKLTPPSDTGPVILRINSQGVVYR